ncbi:MAG: DUF814 domain-containing protein [Cyclobacteriaceae bacterium]|nr:DUF814 domain-containing protein [Cyclobacteriaceae bacterium]
MSECYSQNKEELIIRFETEGKPFFIVASLLPSFSCLSFPSTIHRAKKNSIDLFEKLIGNRVLRIQQFNHERSFAIHLTNELILVFKMHGNRANIILFEKTAPLELFKKNIAADYELHLHTFDREIDWSYENFLENIENLPKIYFTFGKPVWRYLELQHFKTKTIEEQWSLIQEVLGMLAHPQYYITTVDHILYLSLVPLGDIQKTFTDPILALQEFNSAQSHDHAFIHEKNRTIAALRAKLRTGENYFEKTLEKLEELKIDSHYKHWADLIMANLHTLKPGVERITLNNFYQYDEPTEIKLKKSLSPQKNAEIFYRKAKNQQIEIEHLQILLKNKEREIISLKEKVDLMAAAEDLKAVRYLTSDFQKDIITPKQSIALPYHDFEFSGFKIWVGRNAQCNDKLTLQYSYKEDLWLHAKDVAGSHVLIKYQSGKKIPKEVIERAAQLAAFYSKRKNESLCPVIVTPKKFVRKRKGDPAGAVLVEREEVIMVEPKPR